MRPVVNFDIPPEPEYTRAGEDPNSSPNVGHGRTLHLGTPRIQPALDHVPRGFPDAPVGPWEASLGEPGRDARGPGGTSELVAMALPGVARTTEN